MCQHKQEKQETPETAQKLYEEGLILKKHKPLCRRPILF